MSKVEARLAELGITLPRPPKAVANYLAGVKVGEILYVAGTVGTVPNENDEDVLPIVGPGTDSGRVLDLGYNPVGPALPPPQDELEVRYRVELRERLGQSGVAGRLKTG